MVSKVVDCEAANVNTGKHRERKKEREGKERTNGISTCSGIQEMRNMEKNLIFLTKQTRCKRKWGRERYILAPKQPKESTEIGSGVTGEQLSLKRRQRRGGEGDGKEEERGGCRSRQ